MTRKQINDLITLALTRAGVRRPGWRYDVAMGGERSPSGAFQGQDIEGFEWGGDLHSLGYVRKKVLPGDRIDVYVYDTGKELQTNVVIQLPDQAKGAPGWWRESQENKGTLP